MRMKRWFIVVLCLLFIVCMQAPLAFAAGENLTKQEIITIQTKLKNWGYYSGNADGIYGSKTIAAVKYFQRTNGLVVDGIVGSKTAEKLGMQLSANGGTSGTDVGADTYLLARLVYGEARGESYKGKVAVAAVVLNRVKSASFPNTISGVIYEKYQFSVVSDGQINLTPDTDALNAARDALNGVDPTGGCLFYYNPKKTSNSYLLSKPVALVLGNHNFCY